jgi:hypothetical protein
MRLDDGHVADLSRDHILAALSRTEDITRPGTAAFRGTLAVICDAVGPDIGGDVVAAFDLVVKQQRAAGAAAQALALNDRQELSTETLRVVHSNDLPTPRERLETAE